MESDRIYIWPNSNYLLIMSYSYWNMKEKMSFGYPKIPRCYQGSRDAELDALEFCNAWSKQGGEVVNLAGFSLFLLRGAAAVG